MGSWVRAELGQMQEQRRQGEETEETEEREDGGRGAAKAWGKDIRRLATRVDSQFKKGWESCRGDHGSQQPLQAQRVNGVRAYAGKQGSEEHAKGTKNDVDRHNIKIHRIILGGAPVAAS